MNVLHTSEQNRDEVLLRLNPPRITTSIVLLCGAILAFILQANASAFAEKTRPLGNKDQACTMQGICDEASAERDPEHSIAYAVEPSLRTQNHVDVSLNIRCLRRHTECVLNTHLKTFLPGRLLQTQKFRKERQSEARHKIFVEQLGPMPRVVNTTLYAAYYNRLKVGVGALKGTTYVQINAPEYPAG